MKPAIKLIVPQNIKKIDAILEPVSRMCEDHRVNEIRRKKILGEQSAFIEDRVRNMPASDREKFLNQHGRPEDLLKPRYISKEQAQGLHFADAGEKLIKPMSRGLTAGAKVIRPDLSKDKMVETIQKLAQGRK